jgi:hypothetical protein
MDEEQGSSHREWPRMRLECSKRSREGAEELTTDGTDEHGFNAFFIHVEP